MPSLRKRPAVARAFSWLTMSVLTLCAVPAVGSEAELDVILGNIPNSTFQNVPTNTKVWLDGSCASGYVLRHMASDLAATTLPFAHGSVLTPTAELMVGEEYAVLCESDELTRFTVAQSGDTTPPTGVPILSPNYYECDGQARSAFTFAPAGVINLVLDTRERPAMSLTAGVIAATANETYYAGPPSELPSALAAATVDLAGNVSLVGDYVQVDQEYDGEGCSFVASAPTGTRANLPLLALFGLGLAWARRATVR